MSAIYYPTTWAGKPARSATIAYSESPAASMDVIAFLDEMLGANAINLTRQAEQASAN